MEFLFNLKGNLASFGYGTLYGWATINFVELQSDNTIYPVKNLTLNEVSLIVSIINVGGLIGNFVVLPISVCKKTCHLLSIPLFVSAFRLCNYELFNKYFYFFFQLSSCLIIWAQNIYYLLLSRILTGFVLACVVLDLPSFINDIVFDKLV